MKNTHQIQAFNIMAKPTGPACNLNCHYCFYLEKNVFFSGAEKTRMSDQILEAYVRKTIEAADDLPEVLFSWQGGEPTMMGRNFFMRAVDLEKKYSRGKIIRNSLQTNGILLDDAWCEMLREHDFLVGLSMDGPAHIHNRYRKDKAGIGTFDKVLSALKRLQKHQVDVNILCCVTRESPGEAVEIYNFFKEQGVEFIQFIPVVERLPDAASENLGLTLSGPPAALSASPEENSSAMTPWSVSADGFGEFLCSVFDEWIRHDVEKTFVMNFEWALNSWLYGDSPACIYSRRCGKSVILEHNGDIYACDHFMYPDYRRGNILTESLETILCSDAQNNFGNAKETTLVAQCQECEVRFACQGDCPKHRFAGTQDGEDGLSYLCPSYKRFFYHINRFMKPLCQLYRNNLPLSYIKDALDGPLIIRND